MALSNPIIAFDQQHFLDLLERILPSHYLDTIREVGPGYELLQAYALMFARLSLAAERLGNDSFIDIASTGGKATGEVKLFRDGPNGVSTPIEGQSGAAASIVAGAPAGQMRVTGLTGMGSASVGRFLTIQGTGDILNTGTFEVITVNSVSSVDVTNASAVIPDPLNGAILWEEVTRTVTVKTGTVVTTEGGQDFRTLNDVTFLPLDLGPFTVDIEAVSQGYEYNVTGQRLAADGTVLEGNIDTIKVLVADPPLGDITIQVRQLSDTSGGIDSALAALGRNRGLDQGADEDTDTYRNRLRFLPDTVSFDAFLRTIESLLRPFNVGFAFIETFEITFQTAYDGPNTFIQGSLYDPNLFVYDDPDADAIPFQNRWLDENNYRGGIIVVVDNIQPIRDTGMMYDDTAGDIAAFQSPVTGGARALTAFDVPASVVSDHGAIRGGYDGFDLPKQSLYSGLFETLQRIKPAGVSVAVELKGE